MADFKVVSQNVLSPDLERREETITADGYAVDTNSNLFFFNEPATAVHGAPPQQPKPTSTFAADTWFRVDRA